MEAILDNAGISALPTEVGGVLRILLLPAYIEKEEVLDAPEGCSMGVTLESGETGYFESSLVEEGSRGIMVGKKWL